MNFKQKGILVCKNEISNDLINLLKFEFEEYIGLRIRPLTVLIPQ